MSEQPLIFPALTLWQPWGSLLVGGKKCIETRSWPLRLKLPCALAIHAAKRWGAGYDEDDFEDMCVGEHFAESLRDLGFRDTTPGSRRVAVEEIPRGAVVGLVRVVACRPAESMGAPALTPRERAFGDYGPGRWAWICSSAGRFEFPVPCAGNRMIWQWTAPAEDREAILEAIAKMEATP